MAIISIGSITVRYGLFTAAHDNKFLKAEPEAFAKLFSIAMRKPT
jgi:hypothetical protein